MVLRRQEESDTSSSESYEDNFEDAFQNEFDHQGHQGKESPNNNDDVEKASEGGNIYRRGDVAPGMDAFEERFEDEPVLVAVEPPYPPPKDPPPPPPSTTLTGGSHPQYGAGMDPFAPTGQQSPHHDPLAAFKSEGANTGRMDPTEDRFEDEPVLVDLETSGRDASKNTSSAPKTGGGAPVRDPFEEAFEDEPVHVVGGPPKATPRPSKRRKKRGCSRIRCCLMTFFILLLIVLGFFIYQWTKIPKLNDDIEALEDQVQRLEAANNALTSQVDELTSNWQECEVISKRLSRQNDDLVRNNTGLRDQVAALMEQTDELEASNTGLSAEVQSLQGNLDEFLINVAKLILETANANGYLDALEDLTSLNEIPTNPKVTVKALEASFEQLEEETTRLNSLNYKLQTVVGFLNETSATEDSLEQITANLTEQIVANRALVVDTLEISSRSWLSHWDCDYRDVFGDRTFAGDFDVLIPADEIDGVVDYVDGRILQKLCLSEAEFRMFLLLTFPDGLTSNQLITAVTTYMSAALDWYFPSSDAAADQAMPGVSQDMWAAAGYQCPNLESQFQYFEDTII
mmetsp:Transcript_55746/g.84374  ORF Transcript_55746/g.84374 Transcript_55746/m.84374 type:complete len:572 (+) Transcript_55746:85-1800(+)|eukprot:CAMPEP_0117040636 /NCGR_PEP_ID=MMETSP0472-20121206/28418_1 /TAXON_ID=693140 ORGANISM="Tiarina fusus, Strain LIS" /NCGR_SAMPLE_ID=MMETSP0472 /ASSEMBLY_ACC=CAM_ASM_000603 /LENGTH=571 /DNA_ID=CAMNT_0004751407 /DNA_START=74 /DNA_END=1789 /DNA_ORIENTATION=-